MEEHVYGVLNAGLSFDVKWGAFGDGVGLPRAVLHHVSGDRDMSLDGPGLIHGRIQIDCFDKTYAGAVTASRAVRALLEGYQAGPVLGIFLDTIRSSDDEDTGLLQRVSLTFSVTYRD